MTPPRSPLTETSLRRGRRAKGEDKEGEKNAGKGSGLVGKVGRVANLVSTGLNNSVGEGFPYGVHLSAPY